VDGTWNVPTTLTFVGCVHPNGHTPRFNAGTSFLFALDLRRLS
jgi:hypothetical protein